MVVFFTLGCTNQDTALRSSDRVEPSRSLLSKKVLEAEQQAEAMLVLLEEDNPSLTPEAFIPLFKEARIHFKEIEFILAYHYPGVGKKLNGPALPQIEEYDPNATIIDPEGFQVVEELIYTDGPLDRDALITELKILKANLKKTRQYNETTRYTDRHVMESIRLGLVRLLSLGLSGFDSPVAKESIPESVVVLKGMRQAIQPYLEDASEELAQQLTQQLIDSEEYLADPTHEFDTFDRLTFIREYANPLSASLYTLVKELEVEKAPVPKAINDTRTIFDQGAFNPAFFAPTYAGETTDLRIELGRTLFFDPLLSGNNQRSCASCHRPDQGFADGRTKSQGFGFVSTTDRNAPTLINAGYQASSSYDLKTIFVEDRVTKVFESEQELHTSLSTITEKLKNSPEYLELFEQAFGTAENDRDIGQNVRVALSDYVRSLDGMNSTFDKYIRGESDVLSESAKRGFNLFMGKALCGTCHFMPLFNGVVPPHYLEHEAEIIGVPERPDTLNAQVDSDPGRYVLYNYELHRFSFKTPTVRNAALTAPYMHNGVYETMEEVIDFYNRGGGAGIGIDLEFQTLPPDPLNLTTPEVQDLVAFMDALTDTTGLTQRPTELPVVFDTESQAPIQRIVGGIY